MVSSALFCGNCGTQNPASHKHCVTCGVSLQKSTVATIATTLPSSTPTSAPIMPIPASPSLTDMLPSHTLLRQRYLVLQAVAIGGMGTVYMAQDTSLGNRLVAVKEMSQGHLPVQERQRAIENFKREAHMLAGLHSPHLPSIHDHFAEAGRWYLVMDFIQGEALEEYLSHSPEQKLPLEEVLQIGQQLCDVLDYLHTYQPPIIFRDLKPSNIMRSPQGHIYLIDFGIARHFKPGQDGDTARYGSPGYSPPEQYGQAQTSERSDIYSLGATLYHLLSGYNPAQSPFCLPSLQALEPTLPPRLATLITRMLELDEGRRPANIKEVMQELQQSATSISSSILALPPFMPSVMAKPQKLHKTSQNTKSLSIIGTVMGLLVALLGCAFAIIGLIVYLRVDRSSLTGDLDFAYGGVFLFFGLLIFFIARSKKGSHPISIFGIALAIVEICVGCSAIIFGILVFSVVGPFWIDYGSYLYLPVIITFIEGIAIMFIAWFAHLKK